MAPIAAEFSEGRSCPAEPVLPTGAVLSVGAEMASTDVTVGREEFVSGYPGRRVVSLLISRAVATPSKDKIRYASAGER